MDFKPWCLGRIRIRPNVENRTQIRIRPNVENRTEIRIRPNVEYRTQIHIRPNVENRTQVRNFIFNNALQTFNLHTRRDVHSIWNLTLEHLLF